jgi:hypothetical protein
MMITDRVRISPFTCRASSPLRLARLFRGCACVGLAMVSSACVYSYSVKQSEALSVTGNFLDQFWEANGFKPDAGGTCSNQMLNPPYVLVGCWTKYWPGILGMYDGFVTATEATEAGKLTISINGGTRRDADAKQIAYKVKDYLAAASPPVPVAVAVNWSCCDF